MCRSDFYDRMAEPGQKWQCSLTFPPPKLHDTLSFQGMFYYYIAKICVPKIIETHDGVALAESFSFIHRFPFQQKVAYLLYIVPDKFYKKFLIYFNVFYPLSRNQDIRIIINFILKMARGSETAYGNTRFVLPRERQPYIVTSTKRV